VLLVVLLRCGSFRRRPLRSPDPIQRDPLVKLRERHFLEFTDSATKPLG
jgi:hypothetical protein